MFGNLIDPATQAQIDKNFEVATKPHAALPDIYKAARPILVLASTSFFVPQKFKQVLQAFVFGLDNLLLKGAIE